MDYSAALQAFSEPLVMPMPESISGRYSEASDADCCSALPAGLVRALGWLRGHLSEPIQLERLAQISGVRPRTLETHFRQFMGTTPLGWVRRMRLARARQELLRSGPETTVTDVALSSGFSQFGRFAAEYRKVFGELPSKTIERTRTSVTRDADMDHDEAMRLTLGALPFAFAVAPQQCRDAAAGHHAPEERVQSRENFGGRS